MHGVGNGSRTPLLNKEVGKMQYGVQENGQVTDLENGDAVPPAGNVGYGKVFALAKPEAGNLIIATIALLIASTTSILIPKFGGKIIDIVSRDLQTPEQKSEALDAVKNTILAIFLVVIVGSVCTTIQGWLLSEASERFVARLRRDLFSHLFHQEDAFFDNTQTGELLSRLSADTQIIKTAATTNLSEALRNLSTAFIGLGFMFTTSWMLTLLALVVVPLVSIAVCPFGRCLRELSHKTQTAAAVAFSIAEESFGSVHTVKSFAQKDYEISREKVDETLQLGLKQAKAVGLFLGSLNVASTLSVIVVVIYGATLTIKGSMSPGDLTSFILYSLTVGSSSVSGLSGLYTVYMTASGAIRRVFQHLERVSSMPKSGNKCPVGVDDAQVRPEDVDGFAYASQPNHVVLKLMQQGVSLKLEPDSKAIALVDPSGGGVGGGKVVQKKKMGDRITTLHQLVSPFGKVDTASVLHEATEYIKFLHDQVNALTIQSMKNGVTVQRLQDSSDKAKEKGQKGDLKSLGLCLVPMSSTVPHPAVEAGLPK